MRCISLWFMVLLISGSSAFGDAVLVSKIRAGFQTQPLETVDQLNGKWVFDLLHDREYAAVEEFAIKGTIIAAFDPARIEQLQKHRIEAFLAEGKSDEALHAAKALFNVCTMRFVVEALPLLTDSLAAANPRDPALLAKFKLQVLANAQEDTIDRARLRGECDDNSVMMSLPAEPEPYALAIGKLTGKSDYWSLAAKANLELLSGHIDSAANLLDRVYQSAPASEINSATEGLARKLKAQDGGLGRANQFVASIRPLE